MKYFLSTMFLFAIISSNALADSIKKSITNAEVSDCPNESFNLIDATGGDRLQFQNDKSNMQQEYIFYIGNYKSTAIKNNDVTVQITIEETSRKSHIAEDIATVFNYLHNGIGTKKSAFEAFEIVHEAPTPKCFSYKTAFKRSTISISGTISASDTSTSKALNRTLISGPNEHWSLSADLPINNIRQVTYDSKTSSVVEKDKPSSFYIGVNYKLGDVYTNYSSSDWRNLSGKLLFQASNSPNDSMGIGLSYSFSIAELFIARVWTRDDANTGQTTLGTTQSNIIGISFNISKGISWLQPN